MKIPKKKMGIIFGVVLLCVVLCSAFAGWNFSVKISPVQQRITVEYGQELKQEDVTASFTGKIIGKSEKRLPVTTEGTVNTQKLGEYQILYKANYYFWSAQAVQNVTVEDTTPPELILNKKEGYYVLPGGKYEEEGFTAVDNHDGTLTEQVEIQKDENKIVYTVKDSSGNETSVEREIPYDDPIPPEITLLGSKTITINQGDAFKDPGCKAVDNVDGDLSDKIQVKSNVNTDKPGEYLIEYEVKDSYENVSKTQRILVVKGEEKVKEEPDVKPVIPNGKSIYLTFDDGPGPYTETLLGILKKYNVKATFFVVNGKYNYVMKQIVNDGHAIGMHSMTHDYSQIYRSKENFFSDLTGMQKIIYNQTGVKPTIMRFPGGSSNTVSKKYSKGIMTTLTREVVNQGYQYFDWNVSSGDAGETTSTDQVVKNVIAGVKGKQYSIVLQHDIKKFSVNAVEQIIVWGLNNGYTFRSLDMSSPHAHHGVNN